MFPFCGIFVCSKDLMFLPYCNFIKIHSRSSIFLRVSGRPTRLNPSKASILIPVREFSGGFIEEYQEDEKKRLPTKPLSWISQHRDQRGREGEKTVKANSWAFERATKGLLSKSGSKNGSWSTEKSSRSGYRVAWKKKRMESDGNKNERNSAAGSSGYSWEDAANSYFSRGRGDVVNEATERKLSMKTHYSTLKDAAKGYLSEHHSGGEDDMIVRKDRPVGRRGGPKGRMRRNPTFDSEDGGNDRDFLRGWRKPALDGKDGLIQEVEDGEDSDKESEEEEFAGDSRWSKVGDRYSKIVDREDEFDKPEVVRWNRQENWARKMWKEANESTLPKMVGEVVYGVGPVLAALTVGRREFYTLYVQEGLELSGSNRKKDRKRVGIVMKIAERVGVTVKEASKHDLNMLSDNRPHQGLILDASPLEMVTIRQLDPVSGEEGQGPLWVALDEVTDPQNFGAVVRSAYFFGAAGVVVCGKNSAPLSGVVSKASAGSLECIELRCCQNMMQFLSMSAENGWRVLGGSVSARALSLTEVPSAGGPTILVLGSEGKGLRPLVERSCTQLIRIPGNFTAGNYDNEYQDESGRCSGVEFQSFLAVESLNVSVAAGVLLYHLSGNRKPGLSLESSEAID